MTQPPPMPPDPDELASAIVDGILPPAEADRARRDPAVARRVEDILRVRAALRATPAPPPSPVADRAVASAVAAFEAGTVAGAGPAHRLRVVVPTSGGVPVPPPAARRRGAPGTWLAAAAAVLVVGVVAAALVRASDHAANRESDEAATSPDSAEQEENAPAAASEPESSRDGAAGDTTSQSAVAPPYIGSAADAEELDDLVSDNLPAGGDAAAQSGSGEVLSGEPAIDVDVPDCPGLAVAGDPAQGTLTFVADADFDGEPVRVHLYERAGEQRLVATNYSCTDVVDEPYPG